MGFFNTLGGTTSQKRNYRNLVEDEFGNPIPASIQQNAMTMPQGGAFGGGNRGMLGDGLVATPQQQATTHALEQRFPNMPVPTDQRDMQQQQPSLAERMQTAIGATQQQPQLPDSTNQPRQIDPEVMKLIGNEPNKPNGFWKGGGKFRVTDGIAGILAVLGDGLSRNRGYGDGGAVQNLIGGRTDGLSALKEAQAAYRRNQQVAGLPGMNAREFAAFQADPKAWGSNMSRASTSRYDSVTANPGDVRMYRDGGGYWQAPTRGQQYAGSLGLEQGTDAYNGALRDQELGANGPTAFSNQQSLQAARDAQARFMEQTRQQGRMGIEGLRQTNRSNLRGAPTYRDLNPPPPRQSGSRGGSGGRQNIPTVSSPAEAKRLPSGTKFRTPDGRVMQVP